MKIRNQLKLYATGRKPNAAQGVYDYELLIYGDIGESWYDRSVAAADVVRQLQEANPRNLLVRINSYGGSVTDGTAIYNAIRALGVPVTTRIEGIAASIASLIAMAGDTVECFSNALLMIHAPWTIAMGNSADMREMADVLDTYASAMVTSYTRKSGRSADEEMQLLTDGVDHWYTAAQAKENGYVDAIVDEPAPQQEQPAQPATAADTQQQARMDVMLAAMNRYRTAPTAIAASMRPHFSAALQRLNTPPAAAGNPKKESPMNWKALAKALGLTLASNADEAAAKAAVLVALALTADATDDQVATAMLAHARTAPEASTPPSAADTRTAEIEQMFAVALRTRPNDEALLTMQARAVIDVARPVNEVRTELLAALGTPGASSVAGRSAPANVSGGEDALDKRRLAMTNAVLSRMGVRGANNAPLADGQNEYRGMTMLELASACLQNEGIVLRGYNRMEIATMALGKRVSAGGANTRSDFPVILENTLHRLVLQGYTAKATTWRRFCKIGSVTDMREWNRLVPGLIGTLDDVNESGEYLNKNLPDATKNKIKAARRGNIVEITPEVLVDDDTGYITDLATGLGRAYDRAIERRVYSLLGSNPTLNDTGALFNTTALTTAGGHANQAASLAAPTVTSLDAARLAMSLQTAPGEDQEYLDIVPAIAVVHSSIESSMKVLINSEYDQSQNSKYAPPNPVNNLVRDIVASPRLSAGACYLFADPAINPVIEVVFLDGNQDPMLSIDENFRTSGLAWKVEGIFGAGAIDFRGGYRIA